jgi:hypothetical protein
MVFENPKCVFIHIPKTGGTSIAMKLGAFAEARRGVQDHRPLRVLLRAHPGELQDHYRFAFVRNPWARAYSWYRNVMRDRAFQQEYQVGPDWSLKRFLLERPDNWALRPQLDWITDDEGGTPLDFIGKYERLAEDFRQVARELGLADATLPRSNVGDGSDYREHYDKELRDIVAQRYQREIARFGYVFD